MLNQRCILAVVCMLSLSSTANAVTMLKQMPPPGSLRPGMTVLVDNGKCPKGQVLQVSAGSNMGNHSRGAKRTSVCITLSR